VTHGLVDEHYIEINGDAASDVPLAGNHIDANSPLEVCRSEPLGLRVAGHLVHPGMSPQESMGPLALVV
jgi:hypothetical protein